MSLYAENPCIFDFKKRSLQIRRILFYFELSTDLHIIHMYASTDVKIAQTFFGQELYIVRTVILLIASILKITKKKTLLNRLFSIFQLTPILQHYLNLISNLQ